MKPVPPNQQRALVELLTLHELIAHRLVQIPLGLHRGRTYLS